MLLSTEYLINYRIIFKFRRLSIRKVHKVIILIIILNLKCLQFCTTPSKSWTTICWGNWQMKSVQLVWNRSHAQIVSRGTIKAAPSTFSTTNWMKQERDCTWGKLQRGANLNNRNNSRGNWIAIYHKLTRELTNSCDREPKTTIHHRLRRFLTPYRLYQ